MQITHEHLKTLYDLLAMQQAELLTMGTLLREREAQITRMQGLALARHDVTLNGDAAAAGVEPATPAAAWE